MGGWLVNHGEDVANGLQNANGTFPLEEALPGHHCIGLSQSVSKPPLSKQVGRTIDGIFAKSGQVAIGPAAPLSYFQHHQIQCPSGAVKLSWGLEALHCSGFLLGQQVPEGDAGGDTLASDVQYARGVYYVV